MPRSGALREDRTPRAAPNTAPRSGARSTTAPTTAAVTGRRRAAAATTVASVTGVAAAGVPWRSVVGVHSSCGGGCIRGAIWAPCWASIAPAATHRSAAAWRSTASTAALPSRSVDASGHVSRSLCSSSSKLSRGAAASAGGRLPLSALCDRSSVVSAGGGGVRQRGSSE